MHSLSPGDRGEEMRSHVPLLTGSLHYVRMQRTTEDSQALIQMGGGVRPYEARQPAYDRSSLFVRLGANSGKR